ncbi:MSF1-domain-containing protein [Choiromyces venosus 120613-1]|uniref:MSF1-domain-containing protein n=1 Tax=Choiromyces venosus 120613-1 TaxID=1336337 RepID=A0A3N4IZL9_9PEZI|nr:MSF1-domain-containing protein [Choiromyces venosus 120613-1]
MKVFESSCIFQYPWANVSIANWRKYGSWNTQSTHVVAVDTLNRSVDPATGILRTERLITCKQNAPRWLMKILGGTEESYVREVSEVDPRQQTVTLRSMNLTGSNIISVQETVVYSPDPSNPETKTRFQQDAQITAYGAFSKICGAIEDWSVERFGQNARKGRVGFEAVLEMSSKAFRDMKDGGGRSEEVNA